MNNGNSNSPPRLATRFLNWFLKPDLAEEVLGDLEEKYLTKVKKENTQKANWNYWFQTINYLRPFAIRNDLLTQLNPFFMFRHNLKITLRKFRRNKTSFLINLVGLSTGLACALFIFMWVSDEMSVDKFHKNDSRLYQVMQNIQLPNEVLTLEHTPAPLAETLVEEMPEVEAATSTNDFFNWDGKKGLLSNGDQHIEVQPLHAEENFFNVFSFSLLQGNKDQVLADKSGVVISASTAEKLFGTTNDVIGKTLDWKHVGYNGSFQVTGVFADITAHSTEAFDVLFNMQQLFDNDQWANLWRSGYVDTYLVLKEGADLQSLNKKLEPLMTEKEPVYEGRNTLFALKYADKYLYGQIEDGIPTGKGRISYVKLFSLIALFLLLIACVNFMNLSTAEASLKMKEIGVKKTIGATRKDLVFQLLGESLLLSVLALVTAAVLVTILLPQFNIISGKQLHMNWNSNLFFAALGIAIFTGMISGSYPAFYLSGFKPVTVLKGKLNTMLGELWIRKGLVIFQFAMSIIFIVGLLIINQQMQYAQSKNMGYERDNVLNFQWKGELYDFWSGLGEEGNSNDKFYAFMEGLKNVPGVSSATVMGGNIFDNVIGQSGIGLIGDESGQAFSAKSPIVGYDFMKTLGFELLEGRTFSRELNDSYFTSIMINEAAAKMLGLENPVGEKIRVNGENEIIGVVKDFQHGSVYNSIEPFIFRFDVNRGNILAKIQGGQEKETIERLQAYYQSYLPGQALEYSFLDDDYQRQYESEMRVATLSKYFAGLAIIISCLGLFGLAMFTAQRRKKEIGIRKVLGSSVFGIVQMLSKDFTKTVIVAIGIAVPISYLIATNWLADFEYRIDLHWWYFVVPGLTVLLIAWATVGLQTVQAARVNPVESLKSE